MWTSKIFSYRSLWLVVLVSLFQTKGWGDPFSINAQTFLPAFLGSPNPNTVLVGNLSTVEGTQTAGTRFAWGIQTSIDWADRPLTLQLRNDGTHRSLISNMLTIHLSGWMNVSRYVAIGGSLPIVVYQNIDRSQSFSDPSIGPGSAGTGDLRLAAKWTILDNHLGGFGLALIPQVYFPTGDGLQYRGNDAFAFEPRVALEYRFPSFGLLFAANVGFFFRTSTQSISTLGVTPSPHTIISHQARYAIGMGLPLPHRLALFIEMNGSTSLINAENNIQSPLEFYFGARWIHKTGLTISVGGGPGLTMSASEANARAFLTLGYVNIPR